MLTGTPMENRLEELASLMDWVDDHALEPKWRLVPWHTVHADGRRAAAGARNLDTLRERLAPTHAAAGAAGSARPASAPHRHRWCRCP